MTNGVPEHPHSVLGIARGASREEIKAAYHRKIKFWHPDLCALRAKLAAAVPLSARLRYSCVPR